MVPDPSQPVPSCPVYINAFVSSLPCLFPCLSSFRSFVRLQERARENIPPQTEKPLQLHIIIKQSNLLARLKRRHANIRTPITAERITETTVPARADLALDRKVDFGEIVSAQLECLELCVGFGARLGIFFCKAFREAAGTVFAGAATFAGSGGAFGG